MKSLIITCTILGLALTLKTIGSPNPQSTQSTQNVTAKIIDGQINVLIDGHIFTSYLFGRTQIPLLFPLNGPASGETVTI